MFRDSSALRCASISAFLAPPALRSLAVVLLIAAPGVTSAHAQEASAASAAVDRDPKSTDANPTAPNPTASKPAPAENAPLPQNEIYRRLLHSTAWIITLDNEGKPKSTGSGWLLDKGRKLLVTNHHVIESLGPLKVFFPQYKNDRLITDRESYWKTGGISAEILIADAKKDLAVLKLAEVPATAQAAVLAHESPSPGDVIYSIGSPGFNSALWIFTTGTVRSVHSLKTSEFDGAIIESQSPTNPGDSGGPAVNDRNQLVGVVFSYHTIARLSSNFVDLSEVKKFADRAHRLYEPKTADLFVERGLNAKENKRLDAAIADFTAALKHEPKHAAAFARRADCFRDQRDYQTALSDYNDAIAADASLSSAFTGRALVYRAQRKYDEALADATTAIRLRPDYYHPPYVRGLVYLNKQDPSSALTDLDKAVKLAESSPAAKHQSLADRARAHEMSREYNAAFDDYIAALEIKPDDQTLYRRLGDMLLEKANDPQKAFLAANTMLRRKPDDFDALLHRGRALVALNNAEDGLRDLTAAIRAARGNTQLSLAYLQRGIAYDNRNEIKPAATDYLAAIEGNGTDPRAFMRLGNLLLFKAKDASTCVRLFTEVIKNQPKSAHAYLERGRAHLDLNQLEQATNDLDESIRLNARIAPAHAHRGDVHLARRDFDAAIRDYNAALKLNNKQSMYHLGLANAHAGKGDLHAAIKSLDAAINLNSKYTTAYVNRSIARFRTGDEAGSRADMQKARELDPSLRNQEVKLRHANYLRVKNATSEPLVVYFQYYSPTTDGKFRWYPAAQPGPEGQTLHVRLAPGEATGLIDPSYKDQKIKGARFRIWARGLTTNREHNKYRDTDLVVVSQEGYVGNDYNITDYTFR